MIITLDLQTSANQNLNFNPNPNPKSDLKKSAGLTWIIIVLILLSIIVTCFEIFLRFGILSSRGGSKGGEGVLGLNLGLGLGKLFTSRNDDNMEPQFHVCTLEL